MKNFKTNLCALSIILLSYLGQALIAIEKDAHNKSSNDLELQCHKSKKLFLIPEVYKQLIAKLPNQPILQGFLEDKHLYEILLIEDSSSPYIVIKSKAAHIYLAGIPTEDQLQVILKKISNYKTILLICEEHIQSFFLKNGFTLQPRIELEWFPCDKNNENPYPNGYAIKPIKDLNLFSQCNWFEFISSLYGNADQFLKYGFGYALVDEDNKPIAEAYAACVGHDLCEIGIVTHPDHRGKGYSTNVVYCLIDECIRRNLTPIWSCNWDNIASLKVAFKTGFKIKRYYSRLIKS